MEDVAAAVAVQFEQMAWTSIGSGAREKATVLGHRRLRLLELTEDFREEDWCRAAHWGILLEGEMELELPHEQVRLQAGDGLALPNDSGHRHKASVPSGGRARLFLVEPASD